MVKNFFTNGKLSSMNIFATPKEVKYYIILDSLGKAIDEQGVFESRDTMLNPDKIPNAL